MGSSYLADQSICNLMPKNLDLSIDYLKGVGPDRGKLLRSELGIVTFLDLLAYYPFRYEDRSRFYQIGQLRTPKVNVLLRGKITRFGKVGQSHKKRLVAYFSDDTGELELIWFKKIQWIERYLKLDTEYIVYGRINIFNGKLSIVHPEMELLDRYKQRPGKGLHPVYSTTDKLMRAGLDSKGIAKIIASLCAQIEPGDIVESLPDYVVDAFRLIAKGVALVQIHFPESDAQLRRVMNRIKFEELFFLQLELLYRKSTKKKKLKGPVCSRIGDTFHAFYSRNLSFELTGAQKRVVREIRRDMGSGLQMNRLLQGDVGSGKTVVGLLSMLIAIDNGYQCCLMAPTEILAQQHYQSIGRMVEGIGVRVGFLSGSVKGKKRGAVLADLASGELDIIVGTHALIEDSVRFSQLGFAITDEQHRFGVHQRAKLWKKAKNTAPHILVMTATPIPRTLAMSYYGDLDISIIDELPPGRKAIITKHMYEVHRPQLIRFMREQIAMGRQIYVVYPLIEESQKLDLQNLEDGYEYLLGQFPRPKYQIGIVHGRMRAEDKEREMQRFKEHKTDILVSTTVIEVGVDVPNASIMVIENAERFGLSQLHQLRGRVGRGANQSYCVLVSSYKLSKEGKRRIQTMVRTQDGFKIAEVDLDMRGPGQITGTRQSGALNLNLANLATDGRILQTARQVVSDILKEDPLLELEKNKPLRDYVEKHKKRILGLSMVG